ncbi:MAG: hypothetical protein A2507_03015 [Candidatus Magasanikbacteria bacterium RIFOXYD12_FULL_33_17]|nr:MAG: hypothetical protein A2507_03015 [Candidatus Magasanikbacteria bacterium RIFOXYD12_FULL_33_17]
MQKNISMLFLTTAILIIGGCTLTKTDNQTTNPTPQNNRQEIITLYECEQTYNDQTEKHNCKDLILEKLDYIGAFYGHDCSDTENCQALQEGYDWASENEIKDEKDCPNYSYDFQSGCQFFVEDENYTNVTDTDFSDQEQKAEQIVRNLETVKNWLKQFSNPDGTSPITGGKPMIEVDRNEYNTITFHLYESTKERNITFDWYDVDMETLTVTNMMLDEVN